MGVLSGNQWWGEPWPPTGDRAPVCEDDRLRTPVPVGENCMHCGELVAEVDRGVSFPGSISAGGKLVAEQLHAHIECFMRNTQPCSARNRGEPCDHSGSYREDARKLWAQLFERPPTPQ